MGTKLVDGGPRGVFKPPGTLGGFPLSTPHYYAAPPPLRTQSAAPAACPPALPPRFPLCTYGHAPSTVARQPPSPMCSIQEPNGGRLFEGQTWKVGANLSGRTNDARLN